MWHVGRIQSLLGNPLVFAYIVIIPLLRFFWVDVHVTLSRKWMEVTVFASFFFAQLYLDLGVSPKYQNNVMSE